MISLNTGEIHLWCVFPEQIVDDSLINQYKTLLSEEEFFRMGKFLFPKDKKYFLITRSLLRATLSRYIAIPPRDWLFRITPDGKPFIANNNDEARRLFFNLTHTEGLIILGIAKDLSLGIDSEKIAQRIIPLDIAENNFADSELIALKNVLGGEQVELFFRYWTLKEAYFKARGVGLSFPLDLISFHVDTQKAIQCHMKDGLNDIPSQWKFFQFNPTPEHITSICVSGGNTREHKIKLKKSIPLFYEEDIRDVRCLSS